MSGWPNAWDWVLPDRLIACGHPAFAPYMLDELKSQGVTLIVNLHESGHSAEMLGRHGMRELHLPVRDFTPPSQEQLDTGVHAIAKALELGERVAVHCGAGLGRTGTLIAAYLVSAEGLSAEAAIERVRAARPGSIETDEQEAAVAVFASRLASSR